MSQPPSDPNQEMNTADSSVEGQIGQAGRDITQNQGSGNVYKDVTIFNFLERGDAQQRNSEKGLTRQEYKNRQALLNKIRNYWIKGVLEKSLYNRLKIELELEERLDAIEFVGETPERLCQTLELGTKAIAKFDELGEGRTLLILGKPGSGKTITLLEIAQELIERAEKDPELPIPVVFNLSSWNREKWTMKDWLAHEFETGIYKIPEKVSKSWIQNQQLLLLLDGLDEVKQDCRGSCIQAINCFSQAYGQTEIIVCSRVQAYEALSHRLRFQTTLLLQPLTLRQIQDFLDQAGEKSSGIKAALDSDRVLQELAQTPLMLSIMMLAYEGISATDFSRMGLEEGQHYLWRSYINRMLERKQKVQPYSKGQILLFLKFLANGMISQSQTIFLVEGLKPTWLETRFQRCIYPIATGIISGSLIACSYGIFFGLIRSRLSIQMLAGLISGIVWGGLFSLSPNVNLFTQIGWSWSFDKSWKATVQGLLGGFFVGCSLWIIGRLINLFSIGFLSAMLLTLIASLVIASIGIISTGFISSNINESNYENQAELSFSVNQGVWQSAYRSCVVSLIVLITVFLPLCLFTGWFLPYSVLLGCVTLYAGGIGCIQHFVIRTILWFTGNAPQNYKNMLDYTTDHLLLLKVGGGYQFIHNLMRNEVAFIEKPKRVSRNALDFKKILFSIALSLLILLSLLLPTGLDTWNVYGLEELERIPTPGNVMNIGDRLLVDRIAMHFLSFRRGDIITFKTTEVMMKKGFPKLAYIGQILALPEDEISIQMGRVQINETHSEINFSSDYTFRLIKECSTVEKSGNHYFVTIQNYQDKNRFDIYCVPEKSITDRVILRFWPLERIHVFI